MAPTRRSGANLAIGFSTASFMSSSTVPSGRRMPAAARALLAELPGGQPAGARPQEPGRKSPAARSPASVPNASVATSIDSPRFWDLVLRTYGDLATRIG